MNPRFLKSAAVFVFFSIIFTNFSVYAHPELEEQIERLIGEIHDHPTNAQLFVRRADLHRQHEEFSEALEDYDSAARLHPKWDLVALGRAQVFQDSGRTMGALSAANEVLAERSNQPNALVIRARCYLKLKQTGDAVADYSNAIAATPAPQPDIYLERAHAQASIRDWAGAVAGLDEGIKKLGEIPSLQMPVIEYEREQRNFDGALQRIEKIIARQTVKEPWLALRAEVLEQAGHFREAREAFQQVLAGVEQYPPARRNLELNQQLKARATEGLGRVTRQISKNDNNQFQTTENTKP